MTYQAGRKSGFNFNYMADFDRLENAIHRIASGFEKSCMDCLQENSIEVADLVREQLYSGLDGNTNSLRPGYPDDPYFHETTTVWRNNPDGYIAWKKKITPPITSPRLNLPPRPVDVPNLYITGPFHESIRASVTGDTLSIDTVGFVDGPDIVRKYGDDILKLGKDVVLQLLEPYLKRFFKQCGYR